MTDQSNTQEQSVQKKELVTTHEEGLPVEAINLMQFARALINSDDTARGIMTGEIAYPVKKIEPIPGTEMFASRLRVIFEFDVTCNSEPIINSGNDSDVQAHDMALLKSFLLTPQLVDMLIDKIGTEMGFNSPESFIQQFLPMINTDCHQLFSNAIDGLSRENRDYWRDIRDAPKVSYESLLSICTEALFECFKAKFVSSSYEIVESAK